jgi:hypothetical protein
MTAESLGLLLGFLALLAFDYAALRWGVDSRFTERPTLR